jgi:transposase
MSNKSISMTQVALIQQLKERGHSIRSISRTTGLHRKTVSEYLSKSGLSDVSSSCHPAEDRLSVLKGYFPHFDKELSRTGVTRALLWEEYRQSHPSGYGYTQFCQYYSRYRQSLPRDATMYLEHVFGDRLETDFAGHPLSYVDCSTGEIIHCPVLVCVLPASGYTYVEALQSSRGEDLFGGLSRCMEYMGGVPRNVLSDNMRQYVVKNTRYEFTFTELASQWSVYYGANLQVTRCYHPKDKSTVEKHVHISYMRIYARLRDEEFYSLSSLNHRVRELLDVHNDYPRSRGGESRRQVFLSCERSLLRGLPPEPFVVKKTTSAKVQKNYHVELGEDKHFYSVPYRYIGQQTKLIYDQNEVEVYIGVERIAVHRRDLRQWGHTTLAEHMPDKHVYYNQSLGWNRAYFENISRKAGPNSAELFTRIMDAKAFVEQSYISCTGLKRLMDKYGNDRFEKACTRALQAGWANYGIVANILKNGMDTPPGQPIATMIPFHENIRGADAYR